MTGSIAEANPRTLPSPSPAPRALPRVARDLARFGERRLNIALRLDEPLALAAYDLDADGRDELIVLGARELLLLSLKADQAIELGRTALEEKPALVRSRTRIGALLVTPLDGGSEAQILTHTSDGASGGRFAWSPQGLSKRGVVSFYPLASLGSAGGRRVVVADLTAGRDSFEAKHLFFYPADASPNAPAALPAEFYTLEATQNSKGATTFGVVDVTGTLRLYRGELGQAELRVPAIGYAFEIVDLDGDDKPELASSEPTPPGGPDVITLRSLGPDGLGAVLTRIPIKTGGVAALVHARLREDHVALVALARRAGRAELVVLE